MQCSEIREMLSAYIDDVLDRRSKAAVEDHLGTCRACFQELTDLQETVKLLRSLGEVAPPAGFREQLTGRLSAEPGPVTSEPAPAGFGGEAGWRKKVRRLVAGPWKYVAAAVIIVGLGVSIGVYNLTQTGMSNPAPGLALKAKNDQLKTGGTGVLQPPAAEGEKAGSGGLARNVGPGGQAAAEREKALVLEPDRIQRPGQKIVKNGVLSLEVENCKSFAAELAALAEQYGGFIENSSEQAGESVTADFTVRVPAQHFVEMVNRLESLGKVTGRRISGRDVTGEYIDTESRMRNLQKQEERLLSLVDKAKSLNEVLALENELSRVRGEIEVLQGQLKNLETTAEYSTVRLEVKEIRRPGIEPPRGVFGQAGRNLKESMIALVNFLGALVTLAGWVLPWAVLAGIIGGAAYYSWRRRKRGKQDGTSEANRLDH